MYNVGVASYTRARRVTYIQAETERRPGRPNGLMEREEVYRHESTRCLPKATVDFPRGGLQPLVACAVAVSPGTGQGTCASQSRNCCCPMPAQWQSGKLLAVGSQSHAQAGWHGLLKAVLPRTSPACGERGILCQCLGGVDYHYHNTNTDTRGTPAKQTTTAPGTSAKWPSELPE